MNGYEGAASKSSTTMRDASALPICNVDAPGCAVIDPAASGASLAVPGSQVAALETAQPGAVGQLASAPGARSAQQPSMVAIVAAFAAIYLVWGSTYLAIRVAVQTLPPLLMAGARFVIAGVLLYVWLRIRGRPRPTAQHWRSACIVGGLLLLGGNGLVVWAQQTVPSGIAALLVATVPLWMVTLSAIGPRGVRPGWREIAGLMLGFAGLTVLVNPGLLQLLVGSGAGPTTLVSQRVDPWGAAALVLASLSWAIGSLYSRRATLPDAPLLATAMEMICGGGLQLATGLLLGEAGRLNLAAVSWSSVLAFVYLIVLGSWVGFSAYVWLLRVVSPAKVATYAYVNPVIAVLLGWLILTEPLTTALFVAMGLIVPAVVLITTHKPRPPRLRVD